MHTSVYFLHKWLKLISLPLTSFLLHSENKSIFLKLFWNQTKPIYIYLKTLHPHVYVKPMGVFCTHFPFSSQYFWMMNDSFYIGWSQSITWYFLTFPISLAVSVWSHSEFRKWWGNHFVADVFRNFPDIRLLFYINCPI